MVYQISAHKFIKLFNKSIVHIDCVNKNLILNETSTLIFEYMVKNKSSICEMLEYLYELYEGSVSIDILTKDVNELINRWLSEKLIIQKPD